MSSKAIILTAMVLSLSCSLPAVSVSSAESHSNMTQGNIKCDEPSDCDAAIKAIERAANFFKEYRHVFSQSVNVQFKKNLSATMEGNSANQQKVHGLYDSKTGWCEVSHWKVQPGRKVFGSLDMTKEFHLSIITHEVAHHFYHLILSQRNETVSRSLHEFVAYVVQIHTMKKPEKTKVLDLWPGEIFSSFENINNFTWASNPNRFAVMSYRFFLNHPKIMQSILDGKVKPCGNEMFKFFHEFREK